jgi:hypothetical protein
VQVGGEKRHPDLNPSNKKAEEQFKEVVQASGGAVMAKSSAPYQALMRPIPERGRSPDPPATVVIGASSDV